MIRKRGHVKTLLEKLEEVYKKHLEENKENVLDFPQSLTASPEIVSWKESSHQDMAEEGEQNITEFTLGFKFINYT